MKRYDRYVMVRLGVFAAMIVLVLTMIYVLVDFSEKTDDFTDRGASMPDILNRYYIPYIPEIVRLITPVAVFIATLFIAGQMSDRLEMAALRSAGLSFTRLMLPFMAVGLVGMAVVSVLDGYVVPPANRTRFAFEREYLNKRTTMGERTQVFRQQSPMAHMSVDFFDPIEGAGYRFRLYQFDEARLAEITESQRILWVDSLQVWRLESAERQRFTADSVTTAFFPVLDTVLTVLPRDLARSSSDVAMLTYAEALDYLDSIRRSGSGRIEIPLTQFYGRLLYPFGVLIVTLIGFTIGFERRKGGQGVPIAIGLSISFVYLTLLKTLEPLGYSGLLPPFAAAALPHAVFTVAALFMLAFTRK